ncbi:MerR family transcriptional regulator [Candidatus Dependentiae bacterium]
MKRKKGYYSISAVAKMFSVHQQTIRLYEKEGLISPKRSEGNTRLFSEADVNRLEEIIYLTHQLGVNLAGVEMILKLENKIERMQKKMNALFDKTQKELKEEKELSKISITSSAKSLMRLRNEAKKKIKTPIEDEQDILDLENWEIEYEDE